MRRSNPAFPLSLYRQASRSAAGEQMRGKHGAMLRLSQTNGPQANGPQANGPQAIAQHEWPQMNGPRCSMASRGPGFFVKAKICLAYVSWCTGTTWHVAFAPSILLLCSNCRRRNARLAAVLTSPCAVTLQGKVACLSRWRHAPLQEWADGPCPHSCLPSGASPVRQFLQGGKPMLRNLDRCSTRKCCARYLKVSS